MHIRNIEVEVPPNDPYKNCVLGREKYGKIIKQVIKIHDKGFVLALNNEWGTGKTTFVKMLNQDLIDDKFTTIYFNAWENDFDNNPMTAILGELQTLTKTNDKLFKKIIHSASLITKNALPVIVKGVASRYVGSDALVNIVTDTSKGIGEILENEIKEYSLKKKGIVKFKSELTEFIESEIPKKPLVFIIDELDRCRPNYAVSLLEQVKHFFTVPNIVFILSIDKVQLGNAICGIYGSDKINSDEYLRRFFDLEYSLPNPKPEDFFRYLFNFFDYSSFFADREGQYESQGDHSTFKRIGCLLLGQNLTLRQLEKTMSLMRISLRSFGLREYLLPDVFLYLNFLKIKNQGLLNNIRQQNLTLKEFQQEFYASVKLFLHKSNKRDFAMLEFFLLLYYDNDLIKNNNISSLFETNLTTLIEQINLVSIIEDSNFFINVNKELHRNKREISLDYIIDKMNILNEFQV